MDVHVHVGRVRHLERVLEREAVAAGDAQRLQGLGIKLPPGLQRIGFHLVDGNAADSALLLGEVQIWVFQQGTEAPP